MSDIEIHRPHKLGMKEARRIAWQWAEDAEARLDMDCTYEEGDDEDVVRFTRSGVSGELCVTAQAFELRARLGFLLAAFRPRIEAEIEKNLDDLLGGTRLAHKGSSGDTKAGKAGKGSKPARTSRPAATAAGKPPRRKT